jgi:hypothetical protein
MPGGRRVCEDTRDERDMRHAIPSASHRQRPMTDLERFDLGARDVNGYQGEDYDDADADEEENVSQADNRSTQNVEN